MDTIFAKISELNKDCHFADKINTNKFLEGSEQKIIHKKYTNFLFCLLDTFDPTVSNASEEDKKILFHQRILEILSSIDENIDKFNSWKFNSRYIKPKNIQTNIQLCSKNDKLHLLTCIYFMNEYFKIHLRVVDNIKDEYFCTTPKNYQIYNLICENNKFYIDDKISENYKESDNSFFEIDVKFKNVYQKFLEPIGKYNVSQLKQLATEYNISTHFKKQELYDKINNHLLLKN